MQPYTPQSISVCNHHDYLLPFCRATRRGAAGSSGSSPLTWCGVSLADPVETPFSMLFARICPETLPIPTVCFCSFPLFSCCCSLFVWSALVRRRFGLCAARRGWLCVAQRRSLTLSADSIRFDSIRLAGQHARTLTCTHTDMHVCTWQGNNTDSNTERGEGGEERSGEWRCGEPPAGVAEVRPRAQLAHG